MATFAVAEFQEFKKIPRLTRECIVTEKIDGTNAQVLVTDDGEVIAGSRNRFLSVNDDNFGFAKWVDAHKDELRDGLGVGRHFGEWWGAGIQRRYGLEEKRFSLFNVQRWVLHGQEPGFIPCGDPRMVKVQHVLPPCVGLVPVLYRGMFNTVDVDECLYCLRDHGSVAAPGFMNPEGVVVFHVPSGIMFKKTLEKDGEPKGAPR